MLVQELLWLLAGYNKIIIIVIVVIIIVIVIIIIIGILIIIIVLKIKNLAYQVTTQLICHA